MDNEKRIFFSQREKKRKISLFVFPFVFRSIFSPLMADANANSTINPSPKKDLLFWSKIIATQYLIRHPFWKSFALPMIIGQISANSQVE